VKRNSGGVEASLLTCQLLADRDASTPLSITILWITHVGRTTKALLTAVAELGRAA
jgi:hypothetical protein